MAEIDTKILNSDEPFRKVRLIGGAYATVDTPSVVGYCHNSEHKGIVTVTIMQEHDCIAKGCHYFEKFEDYPFWKKYESRERAKELQKVKKQNRKEIDKIHAENRKKREDIFISKAKEIASELEFEDFKIISIQKNKNEFIIFYISNNAFDDWYTFREIAIEMKNYFKKKFILKHAKLSDGRYATI